MDGRRVMKMMKVLSVVDGPGWTGGVEQTLLLSRELRKLGVDARIAAHGDNPVIGEAASHGIPAYIYDSGGRWSPFRRLRRILAEEYDFVIGHKPAAVRHLILPRALAAGKTRFIGVRRVSFPVSRLTVYRFPEKVVAVSESVRRVLMDCGFEDSRIAVIPSGVDTDLFRFSPVLRASERKRRGLEDKRVILNLAKYVPEQKGQHHLLAAVAALKGRYPLKLLLAGLETDGERARREVAAYGLEGTVELIGFRRDIPALLNASDLFVFPSLPGLDAIAGSLLQAMACERVSIGSAVGGIPEYLKDGVNGYLIPPGDAGALRRTLERALELGGEEAREIGRRGRETVKVNYAAEGMAAAYLRLLENLVSSSSRLRP